MNQDIWIIDDAGVEVSVKQVNNTGRDFYYIRFISGNAQFDVNLSEDALSEIVRQGAAQLPPLVVSEVMDVTTTDADTTPKCKNCGSPIVAVDTGNGAHVWKHSTSSATTTFYYCDAVRGVTTDDESQAEHPDGLSADIYARTIQ